MGRIILDAPLAIDVVSAAGTVSVAASGELTVRTAWELRKAITDATNWSMRSLVVDLRLVDRLDPAGLVAVSAPTMVLRRSGCQVTVLLPIDDQARRVAELAGIGPLLSSPLR